MVRTRAMRTLENACRRLGFVRVAGVDEVGRGCLAGPVVAGAVVLDPECHIAGLSDSKQVPAPERDRLYDEIVRCALAWSVASAEHGAPLPDLVLVDAFYVPDLFMAQRAVLHGDARCAAIAAGSIVAKVTRDRLMHDLHLTDPRYGFDRHKGYATADHLAAVAQHGYSPVHRRSFRPHTHTMLDAMPAGVAAPLPQD